MVRLAEGKASKKNVVRAVQTAWGCPSSLKQPPPPPPPSSADGNPTPPQDADDDEDDSNNSDEDAYASEENSSTAAAASGCELKPVWLDDDEVETDAVAAIRKRRDEAEAAVEAARRELDNAGEDYGPGGVWRALRDKCFSARVGEYTYDVCLFGEAKQDSTPLGRWSGFKAGTDYGVADFTGGAWCGAISGARSLQLRIECGAETELVDVREPSTCAYEARLVTPAACVPPEFACSLPSAAAGDTCAQVT